MAVVQGKTGHTGHYLDHKAAMGTDVVVQAGDGMDVDSRLAADGEWHVERCYSFASARVWL